MSGAGAGAIQAAVDAAPAGGVVRLQSGSVHDVDSVTLPDKDLILALQGATINTTAQDSYAFVQRNRRRLSVIGGTFSGQGSGLRFLLPSDERQSYDFAANGVTFSLPESQTAIRMTGVREATINECAFDRCTGISLDETVNTHVMGCQFRDCLHAILADGSATGSAYNAGVMIYNATMLGCGHGVRVLSWDWVTIVNSMIDYCDRPVVLTNVDGASINSSYLSNRDVVSGAFPVLDVLTDRALPGGLAQHIRVNESQIISHVELQPERSIGVRLHEARWFSMTNTSVHFWHRYGVLVTAPSPNVQLQGNVFSPAPGAEDAASVYGTGGDDRTWILAQNALGAPLRNVGAPVLRDNV